MSTCRTSTVSRPPTLIRRHRTVVNTPIIFITGYADEMQTARGYALGAVDYILSPVVAPVLRTKVRVFVDLYEAHEALARSNQELETACGSARRSSSSSAA